MRQVAVLLVVAHLASAANECTDGGKEVDCAASGQLCVDPDYTVDGNWQCTCPTSAGFVPGSVSQTAGVSTTCLLVTACQGKCSAGQICMPTASGSFACICVGGGKYCYGVAAAPAAADTQLDECTAVCPTCARTTPTAQHPCYQRAPLTALECNDPTPTAAVTGDWTCECRTNVANGGKTPTTCADPATCPANSCVSAPGFAGCRAIGTAEKSCVCVGGTGTAEATSTECSVLDECTAACPTCASRGRHKVLGGGNICSAFGQTCYDPKRTTASTGDWKCQCPGSSVLNATEVIGGPQTCIPLGACVNNKCGPNQFCLAKPDGSSYQCICLPPYSGTNTGNTATCTIDECKAACPHCAGESCSALAQLCEDLDTAAFGTWTCKCPPHSVEAGAVALAAGCTYAVGVCTGTGESCLKAGQDCLTGVDYTCKCIAPLTGAAVLGSTATCVFDECKAFEDICTSAGQRCVEQFTTVRGDWMCICNEGVGAQMQGQAACVLDECTSICATCSRKTATDKHTCLSQGQTCTDPDTNPASVGDWMCKCPTGDKFAVAAATSCDWPADSECSVFGDFCAAAGQQCVDSTGYTTEGDWQCRCILDTISPPVTAGLATCTYNECDAEGSAVCDRAGNGQKCFEKSTAEKSLGDWYCVCQAFNGNALRSPAACVKNTCVGGDAACRAKRANCDPVSQTCKCADAADPAATCVAPGGSLCDGDTVCIPAVQQTCVNNGGAKQCTCLYPYTGTGAGQAAVCELDECTQLCATCADTGGGNFCTALDQDCVDPDKKVAATGNWYCKCKVGVGQATVFRTAAPCVLDECAANPVECTGQTCSDPDKDPSVTNDWTCACPGLTGATVGAAADCSDVDECEGNMVCSAAGQLCNDPNKKRNSRRDWTCTCVGGTGTGITRVATCTYPAGNECQTNAPTCTSKGQACADANLNSDGTWACQCVAPYEGADVVGGAARCTLIQTDECLVQVNKNTCVNAGQVCLDRNKTQAGDWGCACAAGGGLQVGGPVVPGSSCKATVEECTETCATCGTGVCTAASQICVDPNNAVPADWYCQCANSNRTMTGAACFDECASVGTTTCIADGIAQECFDTVPMTGSLSDFTCTCKGAKTMNYAQAAVCDECKAPVSVCGPGQACEDPVTTDASTGDFVCTCSDGRKSTGSPAPCSDECSSSPCPAPQLCDDADRVTLNSYTCTCLNVPNITAVGKPAVCDECTNSPCAGTQYNQICNDPSPLDNSTRDFICSCPGTNVKRTGVVAPCVRNECDDNPCPSPQTCNDPDPSNEFNYVCSCAAADAGGTAKVSVGRPVSPCATYVDECAACLDVSTYSTCPCGDPRTTAAGTGTQTCSDPTKHVNSKFDYTCTCVQEVNGSTTSTVGGRVPDCTAPATAAPVLGTPTPRRWIFRLASNLKAGAVLLNETIAAITRIVNLDATGALDSNYVTCAGCRVLSTPYIYKHCYLFSGACETNEYYAANSNVTTLVGGVFAHQAPVMMRVADLLQTASESQGVFEFLANDDTVNQKWIDALKADDNMAAMQGDPNVLLVDRVVGGEVILPTPSPDSDDGGTEWWVWLLIALGVLLLCCLLLLLWFFCCRGNDKDKADEKKEEPRDTPTPANNEQRPEEMQRIAEPDPERQDAKTETSHGAHSDDGWHPLGPGATAAGAGAAGAGLGAAAAGRRASAYQEGSYGRDVNPINAMFPTGSSSKPRDSEVIGFGRNLEGQLGIGEADDLKVQFAPVEVPDLHGLGVNMMVCGSFHSFVVLTDATVLAFGEGGNGQLGLGNRLSPKIPTQVSFFKGKIPRLVACGEEHTIMVCTDSVYAFGSGQDRQLGLGDLEDRLIPKEIPMFQDRGSGVEFVACGSHHTAVVHDGVLYTFGWNRYGQLGLADDEDRNYPCETTFFQGRVVRDLACGVQHTVVLCDDGLYVMGGNTFGQLGLGHQLDQHVPQRVSFFDGRLVRGISAWFHTIVACDDGVWAFGEGSHWKLGINQEPELPNVDTPQLVSAFSDKDVLQVIAGSEHTVVHCTEGVYIWGNGEGGKLGQGHAHPVTEPQFGILHALRGYIPRIVAIGVEHTLIYATPK